MKKSSWLVPLVVVLLVMFLVSLSMADAEAAARREVAPPPPPKPTAVLAPVFLECQDMAAFQAARQLSELAVQNLLGLDLIDSARVDRALREFDFRKAPADLYPQPIGGYAPLSFSQLIAGYPPYGFPAPGQVVSKGALFWPYAGFSPSRTGHLLWLGQRLGADYAVGVEHRIHPKITRHIGGPRLNGRDQIWLTIVEVKTSRVSYIYWPKNEKDEFGVVAGESAQRQTIGTGVTVLSVLAAGGAIGKGRTTRTLGWLGMVAPQVTGAKGDETQVQIDATILAITTAFGQASLYVR